MVVHSFEICLGGMYGRMYVRKQKILSLAFMHSPIMCSASMPASSSAKENLYQKSDDIFARSLYQKYHISTWRSICGAF